MISRARASGCSRRRRRPCSPPPAPSSRPSPRAGGSRSPTCRGSRLRVNSCDRSRRAHEAGRRGRRIARRRSRARAITVADRGGAARRRHRDLSAGRYPDARAAVGAAPPRDRAELRPRLLAAACQVATATTPIRHAMRAIAIVLAACRGCRRAGSTPARTPAGCVTPTARSRRSCTSGPRRRTPTRPGSRTCCAVRCRRRSRCTSASAAARASRRDNAAAGSGCAPRCSTRSGATGVVGSDEHEALEEAARRRRRARRRDRRERLPSRDLLLDPRPARPPRAVRAHRQADRREFHALTNARVIRGRRLCLPGFTSTLPLGVDELRATRSYAQRNIAHCVALTSSRCGSPGGVIVGTADPGGTIERADPFDPVHPRRVTLIVGPSGGGKTVLTNALCLRYIAQGGRHVHPRPLLHSRRARQHQGHRPLRHARVADPRLPARTGRPPRRRRHLPVGRRRPRSRAGTQDRAAARAARAADRARARPRGPRADARLR